MLHRPDPAPTVVLVDDDADLRRALSFSLELDGFAVTSLESGEALLLRQLPATRACLVIDEKLPGVNGLGALAQLRDRGVTLPAILITSHGRPAMHREAARLEARIIEKPLLGDALAGGIREALDLAQGG